MTLCIAIEVKGGFGELGRWQLLLFQGAGCSFQLSRVAYNGLQNSSSREANALFWSLSVLHTYDVHVHSQAKHLYT